MIPVFCKSMIVGTWGRKKINAVVISKDIYERYAKPLKLKISKEESAPKLKLLKKMHTELFGDYIVEDSPKYLKLINEKQDEKGELIKCSLVILPHYFERL